MTHFHLAFHTNDGTEINPARLWTRADAAIAALATADRPEGGCYHRCRGDDRPAPCTATDLVTYPEGYCQPVE